MVFVIGAFFLLAPTTAKADIYYAFIKTTCDKESHTVTISSVKPPDNDPKDTVSNIRSGKDKDLYYLDDISRSQQQIFVCALGKDENVSFAGIKSESHPGRDDTLVVFFNHKTVPGSFFIGKHVTVKIAVSSSAKYTVQNCWTETEAPPFNQRVCMTSQIDGDQIITQSKPTPAKE
jgi:hypothetical protein